MNRTTRAKRIQQLNIQIGFLEDNLACLIDERDALDADEERDRPEALRSDQTENPT